MKEDLTATARLRLDLKKLAPSEEFTSQDFYMYSQAAGMLFKMERRGEVIRVGWQTKKGADKPIKVYKVGVLHSPKEKEVGSMARKRASKHRMDPRAEPWQVVYPEFFQIPEFRILGSTTVIGA